LGLNEFSALKAAWHIERIADLRAGKDIVPTHVQIILSDLCNQNCHFCAYRMDGGFSTEKFADAEGNRNPNRRIPTAKAKEILDDCAALGVGAIEFTGGGEPTVHQDCFEIIAHAQKLGMQTGLVTNGVKLKAHPAVEALTWLRISLDAGTPQTYERIRQSTAWTQVMKALKYAGSLKRPYVGVGFVVTRENYKELQQACSLVKAAGIPYVRVSAMFSMGGELYYAGIEDQIDACRSEAKKLEDDSFKVVDFFSARIEDLRKKAPDYEFCGEQQFVLYIGGDQHVYTCCTNAYTTHGDIGDLHEQRFSEWIKKHRRYDFDARGCHHCQFGDKNRTINFMLDKSPPHVAFV
jgi:MoaA/NifB/PqqE/SkfB family radical SAM enzyme